MCTIFNYSVIILNNVGIEIDLTSINSFANQPADQLLTTIFFTVGWIPIALVFLWGAFQIFYFSRQIKFSKGIRFALLAIDIPRGNEQSMKSVESIFTYLGGSHDEPDLIEQYWEGRYQLSFSFEIVGIEGYTQFLIRTPVLYRDMVESAVYAVYPDAEITEVNDYTEGIPMSYPNDEYDVWGGEFIQTKPDVYPIKTYEEFEVQGARPGESFRDPIATLMDLYGSLKKGEQFWFQIIVVPTGFDWPERGAKEIKKVLGESDAPKESLLIKVLNLPFKAVDLIAEVIFGVPMLAPSAEKEKDTFKLFNLKPQEKKQIEFIQKKVSKLGFTCKLRFVYVARKEVMNKPKAIGGIIGWMKQFHDNDLNSFKPDMKMTATSAHYFFIKSRKNLKKTKIMTAYRDRTGTRGRKRFIMTIDELATLWHFPIEAVVRAPLIQKAPGRKSEPPMTLPISDLPSDQGSEIDYENIFEETGSAKSSPPSDQPAPSSAEGDIFAADILEDNGATDKKGTPPANLPFA